MDEKSLNLISMLSSPKKEQTILCSSPPPAYAFQERLRTNSSADLFTITPRNTCDDIGSLTDFKTLNDDANGSVTDFKTVNDDVIGSVTDIKTVLRSDSILTEVGRPRQPWKPCAWSKRSKCLLVLGVVAIVILALIIALVVYNVKKSGSGDSSTESPSQTHTESTIPMQSPTQSTIPTQSPTQSTIPTQNPTQSTIPTQSPTESTIPTQNPTESTIPTQSPTDSIRMTQNAEESTTQTTKTESTSNPAPSSSGEWASWDAWTSCSVTCGSGIHVRYRTCNNTELIETECEGQYVQQSVCTLDDCPAHGKWTTWSLWGDCGATCGGSVQSRSRQCNKESDSDIDCMGESVQQTNCNDWDCPDCSQTCPFGQQLNDACDTCVCLSSTIQGRVLSASGDPVSYANIATQTAPTRVIAQSNSTGFFNLDDTCISTMLIVTRDGFQDTVVDITANNQTIYMKLEVLPRITEHPQPKYRLTGEDVTFCCAAISAPEITYYEWFHNTVLLDGSMYADNGTTLEIKNVQPSDSGEYKCRANNEVRGIYSNAATLIVKDNEDGFCDDALQKKQVSLPEACVQPGRDTALYEVGDCASKTCRQVNANGSEQCRDSSKSCCIPSKFETKSINCTDYVVELIVIRACSCGSCESIQSVYISGKVVSAQFGSPVAYAEVWLNGELLDYADDSGSFYTTVPDSIGKAIFTVKDIYTNAYLDTTKVVEIAEGIGGTISITIQMIALSDPITIDSTSEAVLNLDRARNDSSGSAALIKVPANAFYRSDGSAYTGMVSSFVTFIDSTDDSLRDAIPGVFQVIDEEGSLIDLESYGMFNLQFQDDAGNALYVDGSIEVSFPAQPAGNFTLWVLNSESGLWESLDPSVLAYSRKRRQVAYQADNVIGEIDMSAMQRRWINIDKMIRYYTSGDRCYYKVRLYKDASLSEEVMNDLARYRVDYRVVSAQTLVTLYNSFMTDYHLRQSCLVAACNNKVGYISLETYHANVGGNTYKLLASRPLLPNSNLKYSVIEGGITIATVMESNINGPFYNNYYTCRATDTNQSHFRFHKISTSDIYTARFFSPGGKPFGENRKIMDTVWYPKRGSYHMICLAKIKVTFSISPLSRETALKFHVFSFGGIYQSVKGFLFGIREYEVNISEAAQYICAEYKCSGKLDQSSNEDITRVRIAFASRSSYSCQPVAVSANIFNHSLSIQQRHPSYLIQSQNAEAYIPDDYGSGWGIYEAHTNSKDFTEARNKVNKECKKPHTQQNEGASVHFHCQIP